MTTEPTSEIKLDGVFENFYEHFSKEGNSRILFTAPFGMGKTYFLNRFFNDYLKDKDPDFLWIRVSPVNYVPSDNVTIFELIKVEILLQLFLLGELEADKIDLTATYVGSAIQLVKRKPGTLVNLLANMLPLLSVDPVTNLALTGVKDAFNKVAEFLSEIKKLKVEKDEELLSPDTVSQNHIDQFIQLKGTHLEFDLISEIIFKTIEKSEKKFVLVVDDLDRLDPAHIFRILNIFSAHNNFDETNKFGFDKVITVCDLGNVEKIYQHFYGVKTDFRGYIDKFVSFNPYRFENFENVYLFVKENNEHEILKHFNLVISCIVYDLILSNKTDLRCLKAALNYKADVKGQIRLSIGFIDLSRQPLPYFIEFIKRLLPLEFFKDCEMKPNNSISIKHSRLDIYELYNLEKQLFKLIGYKWTEKFSTEIGKVNLSPFVYEYQLPSPHPITEVFFDDYSFTNKDYQMPTPPEGSSNILIQAIDRLINELRSVIN